MKAILDVQYICQACGKKLTRLVRRGQQLTKEDAPGQVHLNPDGGTETFDQEILSLVCQTPGCPQQNIERPMPVIEI